MTATVKQRLRFYIYIFAYEGCELFGMNGLSLYWSRMALRVERYLNARVKLRLSHRILDLKYQRSEPDFVQNPKPR